MQKSINFITREIKLHTDINKTHDFYDMNIYNEKYEKLAIERSDDIGDAVILISSKRLGKGDMRLGLELMASFIKSLICIRPLPKAILFINEGVRLVVQGSHLLEDIRELEKKGVEILTSGTCLDYYGEKDKIVVGGIANMGHMVCKLLNSDKPISI